MFPTATIGWPTRIIGVDSPSPFPPTLERPMKRTGLVFGATAKLIAGGLVACGLLAASAAKADVKDGVDAYNAGDYKKAIDEWMPAAAKNDPAALFNLGQVYRLGRTCTSRRAITCAPPSLVMCPRRAI